MTAPIAVASLLAGLVVVVYSAEKLVGATVRTAAGFGVSAFWISAVFIGFDPENLVVGAAGAHAEAHGIALGSILGAAMVAVVLALGITSAIVPLVFARVPRRIVLVPVIAAGLASALKLDGELSRPDGAILLVAYAVAVSYLFRLNRRGIDVRAAGEVAEALERPDGGRRAHALGTMILALVAIAVGSELVVKSSLRLISLLGWSETAFGMTILAFLVSVEEIARELPPALKGRPDVTYGNVLGSVLAFFLMNAGVIALVRPVRIDSSTLSFYLPFSVAAVVLTSALAAGRRISRSAGVALVVAYVAFVAYAHSL